MVNEINRFQFIYRLAFLGCAHFRLFSDAYRTGTNKMQADDRVPVDDVSRKAFAERLRLIMGAESQRDFAKKIGIGQATLGQYLACKTEPSRSTLVEMARVSGRSIHWLMMGEEAPTESRLPLDFGDNSLLIDRYDLHASAGNGSLQFDLPTAKKWAIQKELLPGFSGKAENLMSTDVMGDSMMPTLRDGEPVIVDRSARFDRDGVYLLTIGDDLYVKRLHKAPGRGGISLYLISDNPAYPEVVIDPDGQEAVRVIGRVIWPDTTRRIR